MTDCPKNPPPIDGPSPAWAQACKVAGTTPESVTPGTDEYSQVVRYHEAILQQREAMRRRGIHPH